MSESETPEKVTQPESQPSQTNRYKIDTTYIRSIEGIIRIVTLVSILLSLREQWSDFPMSTFFSAKLPPLYLCIYTLSLSPAT